MNTKIAGAAALLAATVAAHAETPRVSRVTLYPNAATVERDLAVAAGAQRVEVSCLPGSFDPSSLRVEGDADVRVGDLVIDTLDGTRAEACKRTPLDAKIRALEDQRAALDNDRAANDLVIDYLKQATKGPAEGSKAAPIDVKALGTSSDALRRTAQDAFARQQKITRSIEDVDKALAPLREERDRSGGSETHWRTVRFAVQSSHAATLRLAYEVPRAGWTPTYRASLDTTAATLLLERQAQIAQTSGEDWRGVKLKLSTGQPQRALQGPTPWPWVLDVRQPQPQVAMQEGFAPPPMAAPAPVAPVMAKASRADSSMFDVSVFQATYVTEFELAGDSDVAGNGQRITVSLSRSSLPVKLYAQTTPRQDPHAYLIAEASRPDGVWPRGPVQLRRDGTLVGTQAWDPAAGERFKLPFGIDEQVRVKVEGEQRFASTTGVFSQRVERKMAVSYEVHNGHSKPIELQVLEASPVSSNEQIKVSAKFDPKPATDRWEDRWGVVAWEQTLGANQRARFGVEYLVSFPKDAMIDGLR